MTAWRPCASKHTCSAATTDWWWVFVIVQSCFQFSATVCSTTIFCHLSELLSFCLSPDKVGVSFSARFKCPGAEKHAWNPALLFPLCYMPGRYTQTHSLHVFLDNIFGSKSYECFSWNHLSNIIRFRLFRGEYRKILCITFVNCLQYYLFTLFSIACPIITLPFFPVVSQANCCSVCCCFRTQRRPVLPWVVKTWWQLCLQPHLHYSAETCPSTDASTPGS